MRNNFVIKSELPMFVDCDGDLQETSGYNPPLLLALIDISADTCTCLGERAESTKVNRKCIFRRNVSWHFLYTFFKIQNLNFFAAAAASRLRRSTPVMKESPRKRLRVPPNSARREVQG